MNIPVQCDCGNVHVVELRDAGTIRPCSCGRVVVLPSLSVLKRMEIESLPLPREGDGLYRYGNCLVFDPKVAVFPLHCIFTNEPVVELTPIKLYSAKYREFAFVGFLTTSSMMVDLPVSSTWRKRQRQKGVWIGWWLKVIGIIGIASSIVAPIEAVIIIAILSLIVGLAFPYLDQYNGSNVVANVEFLRNGHVKIMGVDQGFLGTLRPAR